MGRKAQEGLYVFLQSQPMHNSLCVNMHCVLSKYDLAVMLPFNGTD